MCRQLMKQHAVLTVGTVRRRCPAGRGVVTIAVFPNRRCLERVIMRQAGSAREADLSSVIGAF